MGRSAKKRAYILECATKVFAEKGYAGVTMTDIINACKISRGGLYLYFSSVKEIFMEVISERNKARLNRVRLSIDGDCSFHQLLDEYFEMQSQRLLHMENSLKPAMYEFFLAHKQDVEREFFVRQFQNSKTLIQNILQFGAEKGEIPEPMVAIMAEHVTFLIEGLGTLAMSSGVDQHTLDSQFELLRKTIASVHR